MVLQRKMHLGIDLGTAVIVIVAEYRKDEETRIIARFPAVMNLDNGATGFEAIEETKASPQDRIFAFPWHDSQGSGPRRIAGPTSLRDGRIRLQVNGRKDLQIRRGIGRTPPKNKEAVPE